MKFIITSEQLSLSKRDELIVNRYLKLYHALTGIYFTTKSNPKIDKTCYKSLRKLLVKKYNQLCKETFIYGKKASFYYRGRVLTGCVVNGKYVDFMHYNGVVFKLDNQHLINIPFQHLIKALNLVKW